MADANIFSALAPESLGEELGCFMLLATQHHFTNGQAHGFAGGEENPTPFFIMREHLGVDLPLRSDEEGLSASWQKYKGYENGIDNTEIARIVGSIGASLLAQPERFADHEARHFLPKINKSPDPELIQDVKDIFPNLNENQARGLAAMDGVSIDAFQKFFAEYDSDTQTALRAPQNNGLITKSGQTFELELSDRCPAGTLPMKP